ncbi:hypothetical protein KVR01_007843 [Diaporthe batatas]|uniref:uncharacterized protein n=1 Tax=Diaporthe batatas TaxID=748121 RepID=UPI001D043F3C|nr:uncharacterized protein KVR01_007843 [Diaporthe batatas]KAG8162078.1 hypothetical protein KVR01_007843 [Diaporthe batatas]
MAKDQEIQARSLRSMSVDTLLYEVARVQISDPGVSYLSTEKILSVPPGPPLRAGQKNIIVIYCGAFNPPHTGHVACLVDALQHMAKDPTLCHFVACIVVPLDEELLLQKEKRKRGDNPRASEINPPIILSGKDRADLLSSYIHSAASGLDAHLRSKVHVWAPADAKTITDIPRLIAAEAKNKGFEMDFIFVRSCEYMYYGDKGATRYPRAIHPQCSMVIFTNVGGRNNDGVWQADGSPLAQEEPWTKWEALVMSQDLEKGARRTVWSTKSPTSEQRILDTRNTLKSESCFSSTEIRRLLYKGNFEDRETLEKDLHEAGAIDAGRLIGMLEDWVDQRSTSFNR